jgi:hypothetical protein
MFPYSYGGNSLFNMVPSWAREGGPERLVEDLRDSSFRQRMSDDTKQHGSATGSTSKRALIQEGRWDLIRITKSAVKPRDSSLGI